MESTKRNLLTIFAHSLSISFIYSLLASTMSSVFFINFTTMNATRYFSIGSEAQNDLQLPDATCAPFHLILYRDPSQQILVANRMAHAVYELNGQSCSKTMTLRAGDTLSIGAQTINWMHIFGITEAEISLQEAQAENAAQENKGLRMQLIFIYLAVALVLFLIAFYI
mgnify:CR=1 FL=1